MNQDSVNLTGASSSSNNINSNTRQVSIDNLPKFTPQSTMPSITPSSNLDIAQSTMPSITPSSNLGRTQSIMPSITPSIMPSITPSIMPSIAQSTMPSIRRSIMPSITLSSKLDSTQSIMPSITQHDTNNVTNSVLDPLSDQIDINNPYNNSLMINNSNSAQITSEIVANLVKPPPFYHNLIPLSEQGAENTPGEISVDYSGRLMLKYFTEKGVINDLISAYNFFVMERIPMILRSHVLVTEKNIGSIKFTFEARSKSENQQAFEPPIVQPDKPGDKPKLLFPRRARQEKRTYLSSLYVTVKKYVRKYNDYVEDGSIDVKLCEIPVMLGSVLDNLKRKGYTGNNLLNVGECKFDPFGYYIIKGDEKIIMSQIKLRTNRVLIYPDKDGDITAQVTSKNILGHMPVEMYKDSDGTLRFHYYLLRKESLQTQVTIYGKSEREKGIDGKLRRNKNKLTVNVLQIFRILGSNVRTYAKDSNGKFIKGYDGRYVTVGKFDDIADILKYILKFIDANSRKKALVALQASYLEIINNGDDYVTIYDKSTILRRHRFEMMKYERDYAKWKSKDSKGKQPKSPIDPFNKIQWPSTMQEINDRTIEYIFTHISMLHITPEYIRKQTLNRLMEMDEYKQIANLDNNRYITRERLSETEAIEIQAVVERKILLLGVMTARLIEVIIGEREIDDRDAIGNQRFVTGAEMMEQLFTAMFSDYLKNLQQKIDKIPNPTLDLIQSNMTDISFDMTNGFISSFTPNQWGPPTRNQAKQENVTDRLDRGDSQVAMYSHLLRINAPTNRKVKSTIVRSVKPSQKGYIDPVDSPSGGVIGLVSNRAIICWISVLRSPDKIWEIMKQYINVNANDDKNNIAMLNGDPIGWCDAILLRETLVNKRRSLQIPFDTTIVIDENILYVYTDGGRPTKPVLIVDDNIPLIAKKKDKNDNDVNMWTADFDTLLKNGIVEYQDQWEIKMHGILATSMQNLTLIRNDLQRNRNLLAQYIKQINNEIENLKTNSKPDNITPNQINQTIENIVNNKIDKNNSTQIAISNWLNTNSTINSLIQKIDRLRLVIKRLNVKRYSHVDMDPTSILGINASLIPFINQNPGPRNTYQCGMGQQALGLNYSNPSHIYASTARYLSYPSRPIVATQMQKLLGLDDMPGGNNVILAIMTMDDNEEDAIVIKKEAIERGLFTYTIYHSSNIILRKEYGSKLSTKGAVTIKISDHLTKPIKPLPGHSIANYNTIDSGGIAIPDMVVNPGDCLVGAIQVIKTIRTIKENHKTRTETSIKYNDISMYAKIGEGGIVDKVLISQTVDGDLSVTVRVRKTGTPNVGDKTATRAAQKSTIGRIMSESELPFTQNGLVPDIIMNPHALPKRMTISTLIEIITSKYAALAGERINATVFRPFEIDTFMELLQTLYGYNMYGNENMRSPITGETFSGQIMIGPSYYQLLKHQVNKKFQVRGGEGPRTMLTGQAVKGKKHGGGVRFGESEMTGVAAYGATHFLRDRMHYASDPYSGTFCKSCNKVSVINLLDERAICSTCDSNDVASCKIPRTFNALTNFISAAGIKTDLFKTEDGKAPISVTVRNVPLSPPPSPPRPPIISKTTAKQNIVVVDSYDEKKDNNYDDDELYDPHKHGVYVNYGTDDENISDDDQFIRSIGSDEDDQYIRSMGSDDEDDHEYNQDYDYNQDSDSEFIRSMDSDDDNQDY